MRKIIRDIFTPIGLASLVSLGACQSLPTHQGPKFGPMQAEQANTAFEQAQYVPAQNFLSPEWMKSSLHTVEPQAYNDGYANSYKITTPHHVYVVQGTAQAKKRIHEIDATERLRQTPTFAAAAKSFKDRTVNLVETPYRAGISGSARYETVSASNNSLKSVSSGVGSVLLKLGHGVKELGVTGVRIASSATSGGGGSCAGIECAKKAGEEVWSGVNSLVGKHAAAKRMHQRLGTDPYSDNEVLQKEISRLAYAESYTGTTYKIGVAGAGIPVISVLTKGVGYYNNAEFVAQYDDAHKPRNAEKAQLESWGVDTDTIKTLYRNKAFTHTTRSQLIRTLAKIGNPGMRARLAGQASTTSTRYIADGKLAIYNYLAQLDQTGALSGYVQNAPMAIAVRNNDTLILPFAADYLQWTQDISGPIAGFADLAGTGTVYKHAEIHVLGQASPLFKSKAKNLGINVIEITP